MGTIVLKSTCAAPATLATSPFVVNEIKVVGSRCRPFPDAMSWLAGGDLDVGKYISAVFSLDSVNDAIQMAKSKGCLKVQLAIAESELYSVGVRSCNELRHM